jgi:SAM-dependent methyltransferase
MDAAKPSRVICPLCECQVEQPFRENLFGHEFWQCTECALVFRNPASHLSPSDEKERYYLHSSDPIDPGYEKFVSPILKWLSIYADKNSTILDFGCGHGQVLTQILRRLGYDVAAFDPYFFPDAKTLERKYDFVIACEVFEHFRTPAQNIKHLMSCIKPNGQILIMTDLWTEGRDFKSWGYHRDPTHVSFYGPNTMRWIAQTLPLRLLEMHEPRFVVFGSELRGDGP